LINYKIRCLNFLITFSDDLVRLSEFKDYKLATDNYNFFTG